WTIGHESIASAATARAARRCVNGATANRCSGLKALLLLLRRPAARHRECERTRRTRLWHAAIALRARAILGLPARERLDVRTAPGWMTSALSARTRDRAPRPGRSAAPKL